VEPLKPRTSKLILVAKHSPFGFKAILDPLSHILLILETAELYELAEMIP
jgi:hypothetical protein